MLSKCANPSCSASFRYFHEGRLFRIETSTGPGPGENAAPAKPPRRVEFFWLCDRCAPQMTLEHDAHGQVTVTRVARGFQEAS
jgi:hypothetical protein